MNEPRGNGPEPSGPDDAAAPSPGADGAGAPSPATSTTGPPGVPPARTPGERDPGQDDEVTRLRAEIARLQAQVSETREPTGAPRAPDGPRPGRWRSWVAAVLVAAAALLAPLAIVATWAHDEIGDTDRYVESITPLASDPAVQNAVIARITNEIFDRLDVKAVTQQAVDALAAQGLPPRVTESLSALSTPLANGVRSFVNERVSRLIKSDAFVTAWIAANREAHTQLVAVLTGEGTQSVSVSGDTVSVNLAAVIRTVKQQLVQQGFALASRIPEVNAQFTVLESADLGKAQSAFSLLKTLARGLPFAVLLLIAAAVYVARDRRRMVLASGLAVAGSMVLLGGLLNVFRPVYLDAVTAGQLPHDAAAVIYDTLVSFMRLALRAVLVVALAMAAGAWLSGPSGSARALRRALTGLFNAVQSGGDRVGVSTGPVGRFVYTYRSALRTLVIGIAGVVYVQ